MNIKLIIVSPKYQLNVGYIARVAKNFGIERLYFVKPRANIYGKKAIMYSKHAKELLDRAKIYESFEEAIKDCDVMIGTSGIFRVNPVFGSVNSPDAAIKKIKKEYKKNTVIGLAIGRDDIGLSAEELRLCDILVHINTNPIYPVLNISHAGARLVYKFMENDFSKRKLNLEKPKKEEIDKLIESFEDLISNKKIRDKDTVKRVFFKMIRKSQLDRHELHAMISALKE